MSHHYSLSALSHEHHAAFVISKRIEACGTDIDAQTSMCEFVLQCYSTDLLPHFQYEEEQVFPALQGIHEPQRLRALREHAVLHELAARLPQGDAVALMEFGQLLAAHVRFEERELFPLYEALIEKSAGPVSPAIEDLATEQFRISPVSNRPDLLATLHVFDARGISTSFRHAAIICALDLLAKGETLRLIDDHDPAHLLLQISARFRKAIVVHQVRNETGEIVVDLTRVSA